MFQTYLVDPLYNVFIYLIGIMPGGDVGLAIIALTLLVRGLFYPAFAASIRTQMQMQSIQGEVDAINEKYKDDKEEKAKQTMALFKEKKVRPLAGIVALLVQIPVFLALYFAFFKEGFPHIATNLLYSFVKVPPAVNVDFLGVVNLLSTHVILLALVVAGLQFLVARYSFARIPKPAASSDKAAAHEMQRRMMLYFLPVMIASISFTLPAAAGIYFATGNIVSLCQEWLIRKQMHIPSR